MSPQVGCSTIRGFGFQAIYFEPVSLCTGNSVASKHNNRSRKKSSNFNEHLEIKQMTFFKSPTFVAAMACVISLTLSQHSFAQCGGGYVSSVSTCGGSYDSVGSGFGGYGGCDMSQCSVGAPMSYQSQAPAVLPQPSFYNPTINSYPAVANSSPMPVSTYPTSAPIVSQPAPIVSQPAFQPAFQSSPVSAPSFQSSPVSAPFQGFLNSPSFQSFPSSGCAGGNCPFR